MVRAPDGVTLAMHEAGNKSGPAIVLVHGFSQCHLSWSHQIESALADEFRLVSFDLRGHGNSDKPLEAPFYREGKRWADDLAAILDAAAVDRAVAVAWSYGGRVIADFLQHHGCARLAGINLVGSKTRSDPAWVGPDNARHQSRMASADIADSVAGTIGFLRLCATHWDQAEFERHLAFNMLVPPQVRAVMGGRQYDVDALYARLTVPVLFTHGTHDRVVPLVASQAGHAITPGSVLSVYDGIGHAPFVEDAARFNVELAAFARRCFTRD
jgi:pimeloyl-ACP methyl ester carboxylesterase